MKKTVIEDENKSMSKVNVTCRVNVKDIAELPVQSMIEMFDSKLVLQIDKDIERFEVRKKIFSDSMAKKINSFELKG